MRIADFIASKLVELGAKNVFSVTGGGAMHLNDAFGRNSALEVTYTHHEQSAAMAAEAYSRLIGIPAVICVTTGPGGINAFNGVFGAYTDSIPIIVISGQVRFDTTVASTGLSLRQLGDQEFAGVIDCAKTMTKYAVSITKVEDVSFELEKAWQIANSGRKGPVWIDVPMNIQGAIVADDFFQKSHSSCYQCQHVLSDDVSDDVFQLLVDKISTSKRPLIYTGSGIRSSGAHQKFLNFIEQINLPVVTSWNAHDVIPDDHPQYVGRPGILGDRPGNFAVQAADFILVLGSRLSIRQVGYNWKAFAPNAFIAMVDIDPMELIKPTLRIDFPIRADLNSFFERSVQMGLRLSLPNLDNWWKWLKTNKARFPIVQPKYWEKSTPVNPYCFIQSLFKLLPDNQIVVAGDGTACVVGFQAGIIKSKTRFFHNSGSASMGYDLPAAIGASIASGSDSIVCITGDGSLQMNIQELQTIVGYNLPVKIFVINNEGYHSIRQTQSNYFGEPLYGVGPSSGVTFPNLSRIADAYGFPYFPIKDHIEMPEVIKQVLSKKMAICEVFVDIEQQFEPKASSKRLSDGTIVSAPLEDMAPFLSEEELKSVMNIINE